MAKHERFVYVAPPILADFHLSTAKVRAVRGPIGSGKSTAMVMELFRKACEQEPDQSGIRRTRMVIVRNTLSQLKNTCLKTIMGVLRPIATYKVADSVVVIEVNDVVSEWLLIPLDTPHNVDRLLSLELTWGWISEHREIDPQIAADVYSRCGRYPSKINGGATAYGLIMETNSFSEDSPWNAQLEVDLPANWSYHVQPSALGDDAENKENLPEHYYSDMLKSNSPEWCQQYIENKITPSLSGQAVFKSTFSSAYHVSDTPIEVVYGYPLIIGMDFARHPAAVIGQFNGRGVLRLLKEVEQENIGVEKFTTDYLVPILKSNRFDGQQCYIVGDPAGVAKGEIGEESVYMMLRRLGFNAVPAVTNYITPRLRAVEKLLIQQRFGEAALLIDGTNCPITVLSFKSKYKFTKKRDGNLESKPDKSRPWSDVMDAVQYLCLGSNKAVESMALRYVNRQPATETVPTGGWT